MITPCRYTDAKHMYTRTVGTDYCTARAFIKGIGPAHQLLSNEFKQSLHLVLRSVLFSTSLRLIDRSYATCKHLIRLAPSKPQKAAELRPAELWGPGA